MNREAKVCTGAPARAVALWSILAVITLFPHPASAQLGGLIVSVTAPASGSTVSGTVNVNASVTLPPLTAGVQFQLDGVNLGAEDTSSPYSIPWNTVTAANGSHTLRAVARNAIGLLFFSDPVPVTVLNDVTPPTVGITSPASGASVTGTISVTANATDNIGVAGVQFQLDGAPLGAEDTAAPYAASWNTGTAAQGSTHTLTAVARDAAGNTTISSAVTVTILDTTAPSVAVTSPASGATVSGTVTVTATASDNIAVLGVQFRLDGANLGTEDLTTPYSSPWNTNTAAPGTHTLSAIARDAAGNTTTSAAVTVTVADTSAPAVSITAPSSGATVTGTINVTANASDNVGVAGVQFRLDGANLGAEDTSSPYATPWNTATATAGSHSLTAVARDAAGNTTTSAAVTVTVPDTTAPAVNITSPSSGATVTGTIAVNANASDNVGVAGVQFRLDGANLGAEDTSNPYSTSWNTTTAAAGSHTLTAVARDAAGNTTTSASVTVTVPDTTAPSVGITSPASGATVAGTITVSANAADNVGVAGVQFLVDGANLGSEDTAGPYSTAWDTVTVTNGSHTLTAVARDAAGNTTTSAAVTVTVANSFGVSGDILVGFLDGRVQWHAADGTLRKVLVGVSDGESSGLAFDASGILYVPHWYSRNIPFNGNTVARFDLNGELMGAWGSGYNCNPSSLDFDAAGNVYVGQADCDGDILKLDAAGNPLDAFNAQTGVRGADHIDLAPDGCTVFYSNWTKDVLRYNVCTDTQMPNFNLTPLPGDTAFHLRLLADGGVLVADSQFIVRLDATGNVAQVYSVPENNSNWWVGVEHVNDGTFWAVSTVTNEVVRFHIATGAILSRFTTSSVPYTAVGVAIKP
jgi:hypothetical protein